MMRVNWRIKRIVQKLERRASKILAPGACEQSEVYQLENHIDRMIAKAGDLMQRPSRPAGKAGGGASGACRHRSTRISLQHPGQYQLDGGANAPDICGMISDPLPSISGSACRSGGDIVTVEDELELARVYIEIQNSGSAGSLRRTLRCPRPCGPCSKFHIPACWKTRSSTACAPKDD